MSDLPLLAAERSGPNGTVYIVDDDLGVRKSLAAAVSAIGLRCCAFDSAEALLAAMPPAWPACIVTDLRLEGLSGLELHERLRAAGVETPVVVITAYAETRTTVRLVQGGALTVLEKPCRLNELTDAVERGIALDRNHRRLADRRREAVERIQSLNDDKLAVLRLITAGLANKVIAARLGVGLRTVEMRRQRIFQQLGVESVAELVRLVLEAEQAGLRIASPPGADAPPPPTDPDLDPPSDADP